MGNFKFGVSMRFVDGRDEWVAKCRRAEELGYDVISVPDHLGARPSPFPCVAVAAAVTERPRVGTLVSNVPFYNLALFARDVVSTVHLTGERLELGLGAGHMKAEFDDAGLPWTKASERVAYLAKGIEELRRRLDDQGVPQPPLLLGGNSDSVLRLAAEHADIVGFAGLRQAPGRPPGTFRLDTDAAAAMDERVAFFTAHAGERAKDIEYNMLVQRVSLTDDRRAAAAEWLAEDPEHGTSADLLLDAPQLLMGSVEEIAAQLRERRERYGFSYITVFEAELEKFAPVVALLRNQ
jgi:probable F420-dependent oxidoreductase